MSVKGKIEGTEPTRPDGGSSDVVVRSEGGCKVLIFRRPSSDDRRTIELEQGQALSEFDAAGEPEVFQDVSLVYVAERRKRAPTRAMLERAVDEARETSSLTVPRWLKKVLLMATFTAWTAAAIALSLALA